MGQGRASDNAGYLELCSRCAGYCSSESFSHECAVYSCAVCVCADYESADYECADYECADYECAAHDCACAFAFAVADTFGLSAVVLGHCFAAVAEPVTVWFVREAACAAGASASVVCAEGPSGDY